MKKRLFTLFLAVIMSLSLFAACTPQETSQPEATEPPAPTEAVTEPTVAPLSGTLELWVYEEFYKDQDQSPLALATKEFTTQNPGVTVNITPVPYGSSSYRDKYIQAANGGGGPDLLQCDNIWVPQFAAMDIIIPLTTYMGDTVNDFFQGTIDAATYNNQVFGVPFAADSMVLFYNKDMFTKAGLDPNSPPTTWEEFRADAIALRDAGMGGYGLLGGWGGSFEWLPWFWQNGGEIIGSDGKVAFNSPEGMEATKFFLNLLTVDKVVPEAALTWKAWDELAAGFANQTIGMCQGMAVLYNALEGLKPTFNWGVAVLPGRVEQANTLGGSHWVINKNSKNADLAYEWIKFISSKEQALNLCDSYLRISARKDASEQKNVKDNEITKVFVQALETSRPRPIIPEWTTIDYDCIQPAFMKVIFEGAEIDPSMADAEVAANAALEE
ncbi:MAG: extracellular solute-binding protein [Bacillota bacterium]